VFAHDPLTKSAIDNKGSLLHTQNLINLWHSNEHPYQNQFKKRML